MILYLSLALLASSLMALGLLMMKSRSTYLPAATGANVIGALVAWLSIRCGSADSACRLPAGAAT